MSHILLISDEEYKQILESPLGYSPNTVVSVECFVLPNSEAKDLYNYFLKHAGYISHEFTPEIHELYKRLDEYVNGKKEFRPVPTEDKKEAREHTSSRIEEGKGTTETGS